MDYRVPSEAAIEREMEETGFGRIQCIRRIQQRKSLRTRLTQRAVMA